MEKLEGPTQWAREHIHKFNVGLCVARMDRHGSKSYEHLSGVCTSKSTRRRFQTQDISFVEREVYQSAKEAANTHRLVHPRRNFHCLVDPYSC